ncbi:MAG: hypothetical protein A3A98_03805 [Candidatus Staskawiczbacteria bacterium RIFCSPLOWO2_01_FULL_40_39]|uniref:TrbC/VirB2 family protein n=1 Tax=Candidatus Staskawiczbacteria bacterium RIFCSPHIGHO2_01_FULL_39_25 TaxID=1802202 RepID=A0A1G2HND9_9BACT|nr:MAG: hypothetical protein A2730_03020 [Candidatus Staskawiczbacteria bacterium RIFCSPHIGHO2_01_FULL_39_25]OGZ73535.1 MAG: hypothetical protein A3A98_03805 [Candidatus Staskawiczbacteria bacterium RIFCSPLOWO2_01_FULL_40_39]OGZ75422.1 MAG: hypothetical protein A3I87_03205 [Candidatus Staskawiczbacteria bacterium RIFCSPLOWO2_02_FULL_39_8]
MKNFVFSIALIILLGFGGVAAAEVISIANPLGANSFGELIANITEYIFGLIAGLAVVMFLWAGILFLTSAGNPGQIEKAKKAALYAVIGLAIGLAGSGLIELVTNIISGNG